MSDLEKRVGKLEVLTGAKVSLLCVFEEGDSEEECEAKRLQALEEHNRRNGTALKRNEVSFDALVVEYVSGRDGADSLPDEVEKIP